MLHEHHKLEQGQIEKADQGLHLSYTPPSDAEEDSFHAKLRREIEEEKKAKSSAQLNNGIEVDKPAEDAKEEVPIEDDNDEVFVIEAPDVEFSGEATRNGDEVDIKVSKIEKPNNSSMNGKEEIIEEKITDKGDFIRKETTKESGREIVRITESHGNAKGNFSQEIKTDMAKVMNDIGLSEQLG
jgi:hypothetical protein